MNTEGYSAYIYLMGLMALSEQSHDECVDSLNSFHAVVENSGYFIKDMCAVLSQASCAGSNINVTVHSNCAYIESDDLLTLCLFLKTVRNQLLARQIFFKGAVIKGDIGTTHHTVTHYESNVSLKIESNEWGDASKMVELIGLEQKFKGIGFYFNKEVVQSMSRHRACAEVQFIESCFVKHSSRRGLSRYYDIAFLEEDLSFDLVEGLITGLINTKSLSKRISRYYIAVLILLLKSIKPQLLVDAYENYRQISKKRTKSVEKHPLYPLFRPSLKTLFKGVPGSDSIYYALLSKIFELDKTKTRERDELVIYLFKHNDEYLHNLENAEPCLISYQIKDLINKFLMECDWSAK